MSVIIIILAISLCIAGGFLAAFLWSVKDGQFDDQESPARRMLFDDTKSFDILRQTQQSEIRMTGSATEKKIKNHNKTNI